MGSLVKKVVAIFCIITLVFTLAGCKSGAKTDNTSGKSNSKSTEKEIEFWTVFTGPDGENMTRLVEEYNNTNPKIKVIHRPIEAGDLYQKIPTLAQTGENVPDLTVVHVERLPLFVENNVLMPMNDYIESNGKIKAENYVPTAWDKGEINGKHYSVPLDVHSFVTYYNIDLLEKYGPNVLDDGVITFDEVKQVGKTAADDGILSMGITWMRVKFLAWYNQLSGELSSDGENPDFNNDKAAKVLNTVKDLHDKGYTNVDGDDSGQLFRSGQMVFWPEGIWMKNSLEEIEALNFGMTHFIQFDPAIMGNWTSSHQMVMLNNPDMTDERAAAVMDFISWIGDNSIEWARAGQVPASLKILENEEFKSMKQSFLLESLDALLISDYKYYGYAVEALDKIVWEVPFGRMEAKEALDQAQKETADRIKAGQ